jgi:hypothetical protein
MEAIVAVKDLLEFISNELKIIDEFKKYTFSKNNRTLMYKLEDGYYRIELNTYKSFDLDRKEASNEVIPYYYRKFNILHDWFKKHSILSASDFNARSSIFLEGSNLGFKDNFHFLITNQDFYQDFTMFKEQLIKTEKCFLNRFQSLYDLYDFEVLPIVSNKDYKFNMNSDEDLFILLRLVYIVSPNDFEELNNRVYNHFKIMCEDEHPHALAYMPKYDEIISDLKMI